MPLSVSEGYHLPDDDDALVTTEELAVVTRTSPPTVRWWRHVGRGPKGATLPNGRRVLYRAGDVRAWLASGDTAAEQSA